MNKKYIPYGIIALLVVMVLTLIGYIFLPHLLAMQHMKGVENGQIDMQQTEIPFPGYSQAMADHCVMMDGMRGCEPYNELRKKG